MLLGLGLLVLRFCQGFNFFAENIFSSIEHREEVVEHISIDSLPDDILIHILSFLPSKQAALTSVLSKRWRTLFVFTNNLEFDYRFFLKNKSYLESQKLFRNFLYGTLALREDSQVKKFSLTLKDGNDHRIMNHCIRYAMDHGVSELHLCIILQMSFLTILFTSTTLVKLSLGSLYIEFPSDTSLPSLKVLLLHRITFKRGQLSDVLLAACPLLEDLAIDFPRYGYEQDDTEYSEAITSKTIKILHYSGEPIFIICQFDLLVKATLDLRCIFIAEYKQNIAKLISGIRNVKILHLTLSAVEVISECCEDELPVFNNLVELVFSSGREGWKVFLPRLLECSPNLKVLVLSGLRHYTVQIWCGFVEIQIPFKNQIEKLSIKLHYGTPNELRHIGHFLLNMECLKELKVYLAPTVDEPKKMQLTEDLMKLPTASSEVKIQVI